MLFYVPFTKTSQLIFELNFDELDLISPIINEDCDRNNLQALTFCLNSEKTVSFFLLICNHFFF